MIEEKKTEQISRRFFHIEVSGVRLHAKQIVPENKNIPDVVPTLVFLHEGLGSIGQWRDFPEALCSKTGLPGLVYERRGYGKSDSLAGKRPMRYLQEEALQVLPLVLRETGIVRPIFIGHSDGGSIALIYASEFPEGVLGVVTEAAHVFVEDVTLEGIRRAVEAYEKTDLRNQLARYHGEETDAMFKAWSDTWLSPAFHSWNIEEYLPGIRCPLLVIQGKDDEYGTAAQVEAIVNQVSGTSQSLLLTGCAHAPHQQARNRVLDLMSCFIEKLLFENKTK